MIELRDVRKVYEEGRPGELVAVDGVSLAIAAGTVTVIRGPSGSGKTTLLSLVGAMARPTAGRIVVEGRELTRLPERFLTEVRRRTFGFVFQQGNLIPGLTTLENVMLPGYPLGVPRDALVARARELLGRLAVGHRADAKAEWLSGGEAQRAAIARALVNRPRVLVADEPTAQLDTRLSREFMEIVGGLRAEGMTVLVASHDPIVHEAPGVDRSIAMRDGRLDGEGDR
jgi:putative ABC transport system ATP-binding protein